LNRSNLSYREHSITVIVYDIIQLLPSYEMNIESRQPDGNCFVEGFSLRKTTSRGLTT